MTNASHTPGPWVVEDRPPNMKVIFAGEEPGNRPSPCLLMDGDQEANARLIAAAPEMLKELQRLYMKYGHKYTIDVIAKATGKQS